MFTRKVASAVAPAASKTLKSAPRASILHVKVGGQAVRARCSEAARSTPIELTRNTGCSSSNKLKEGSLGEEESLSKIVNVVRAATAPLADLDETIPTPLAVGKSERLAETGVPWITHRSFSASLVCPKKFYLFQQRPDLIPEASIGESIFLDDAAGFGELARQWDRLQFGSKAILISDRGFVEAAQHTENVIVNYFETTYASLREQAPSLTIHRPAFLAPFGGDSEDPSCDGANTPHPLLLCARPLVLRYRPKDNQWVILEAQAIVDPLATAARAGQVLQRLHFSALAFLQTVTQPHIPISLRKRFLNIDLDAITKENQKGHVLESTARAVAPIDLKRSGVLHLRQFFPGPVTLLDCDPPRLVKFVQRLSLEDLLEADARQQLKPPHPGGAAGAFDLPAFARPDPAVQALHRGMQEALRLGDHHPSSTSSSSSSSSSLASVSSSRRQRRREAEAQDLFEAQQRLLRGLLRHHTRRLVGDARDPAQVQRWTAFASDADDGLAHATYARLLEQEAQPAREQKQREEERERARREAANAKPGKGAKRNASKKATGKSIVELKPLADVVKGPPPIPGIPHFSENIAAHCSRGDTCPFFVEGMCLPQKVVNPIKVGDNHLFTLPSTSVGRKVAWWGEGLRTIRDVLYQYKRGHIKLTAPQLRYVKAVAEGCVAINPKEIDKFFAKISYPTFIIDFEATQFALPPYQKVTAYQSVPFQFSLDVFQNDILTETPTHYNFLHFGKGYSPNEDPRPHLIEELMRIVKLEREKKRKAMEASGELMEKEEGTSAKTGGRRGPKKAPKITKNNPLEGPLAPYDGCFIAHFSSFEKSCLEKLGQLEERFKEEIKGFYFLDTIDLIKKGFSHPNAHGSNSLKKVLPALCPDFQYGVFGSEAEDADSGEGVLLNGGEEGGRQDEQKGENAMGIFRLWYHQEGGGTIQDLRRSATAFQPLRKTPSVNGESFHSDSDDVARTCVPKEVRERVWSRLRIQLLEYCSLDTKALYEIMREIWKEKETAENVPSIDKSGWVYVTPTPREVSF